MDLAALTLARPRQRGVTLVELMIATVIGLLLVAIMGSIYLGSKSTWGAQDAVARLQESGRFALDTIATDLRMAGFRGCRSSGGTMAPPVNTLNGSNAFPYDYTQGVWASHAGADWTPPLPARLADLAPAKTGDVLVVQRAAGTGWALAQNMWPDATAALVVTDTPQVKAGDVMMISDCNAASIFQVSSAASAAGLLTLAHLPAGTSTPGVATADLKHVYQSDAVLHTLQTDVYYLAPSVRHPGAQALFLCGPDCLQGGEATELVTGVDRFSVTAGVDATGGTGQATQYLPPGAVPNWSNVVSARIELLLASANDNVATKPQPYTFGGVTTTPTDRRLRVAMATTSTLRNAALAAQLPPP